MSDKNNIETETISGQVIKTLLIKAGGYGAVIIILCGFIWVIYSDANCESEKARKDVIECYDKRANSTKIMIDENNKNQIEMIKAIQSLKTSIDRLSDKIN
jgi:hypothetical protein